jgi:hypothetical protein
MAAWAPSQGQAGSRKGPRLLLGHRTGIWTELSSLAWHMVLGQSRFS